MAQTQSDAIRAVAKAFGVKALSVVILDDFLMVVPRRARDSDETVLQRARMEANIFDALLDKLGLPKAKEKDQEPAFSTTWFGFVFNSKHGTYGITKRKWEKLRQFFEKTFQRESSKTLKKYVEAETLERALGKFHHATEVWSAGRPALFSLWRLFHTANFRTRIGSYNKQKRCLWPRRQQLYINTQAIESLKFWQQRLANSKPPSRFMLRCGRHPGATWVNIFRLPLEADVKLITATASVMGIYSETKLLSASEEPVRCHVWMTLLLESLHSLEGSQDLRAVFVRTNIRQLNDTIRKQLYVKSDRTSLLAREIHIELQRIGAESRKASDKATPPIELRCALLPSPVHVRKTSFSL